MTWPLQSWTEMTSPENHRGLKGGMSADFLKEKGKSKFETLLCGYHSLTFQPEDFKLARGGHGPWCRDRRQHITNNNNNIIRIIIKEFGRKKKQQEGRGRMRQERGGYLRQHLAVASLAEKEKKKKKEDIYLYTGKGGRDGQGCCFSTARLHHLALG